MNKLLLQFTAPYRQMNAMKLGARETAVNVEVELGKDCPGGNKEACCIAEDEDSGARDGLEPPR